MVKFCVLASGSSGNAALLATENTRILVDAGPEHAGTAQAPGGHRRIARRASTPS